MIAYKVFERTKNGKLKSIGDIPNELKFVYSRKEVNFPKIKGSMFFCFHSYDEALSFYKQRKVTAGNEIWEVEVPNLETIARAPRVWTWETKGKISVTCELLLKDFWEDVPAYQHVRSFELGIGITTAGAAGAKSVRLIKKVTV